jgi:hypothetical protein
MDAVPLTQLFATGALLFLVVRFALHSLSQAEAGFASLFVPPDRTLPWPRGVQESDAPWGWRPPIETDNAVERDLDASAVDLAALLAEAPAPLAGHSRYVEPPHKVDPIRFRTLPQ